MLRCDEMYPMCYYCDSLMCPHCDKDISFNGYRSCQDCFELELDRLKENNIFDVIHGNKALIDDLWDIVIEYCFHPWARYDDQMVS